MPEKLGFHPSLEGDTLRLPTTMRYLDSKFDYFIDDREGVDRWGRPYAGQKVVGEGWDVAYCALHADHEACVAEGSLVLTRRGYVQIETVASGDEVLSHRGRWCRVEEVICNGERDIVEIWATGVPGLRVTPDHLLYSRAVGAKTPATWQSRSRYHSHAGDPAWVAAEGIVQTESYVAHALPPAEHASEQDWRFWWTVGRWLGDGWISDRIRYDRGGSRQVSLYVCCAYEETAELTKALGDYAGFTRDAGTCTHIRLRDPDGALRDVISECGRGAANKHVSARILGLPKFGASAVLEGYLSADGTTERISRKATSVSRALVLGMALVAERATGVVAGVRRRHQGVWSTIRNSQHWTSPAYEVHIPEANRSPWVEDGLSWKLVRKIAPAGRSIVYDLKVTEDHSFIADGAIVHNCPGEFNKGTRLLHNEVRACDLRCGECIPAGQFVATTRGQLLIEDVRPGDSVIGRDGRGHLVTKIVSRWHEGDVVEIHARKCLPIRTTRDHEILTEDGWIRADALTKDHRVIMPKLVLGGGRSVDSALLEFYGRVAGDGNLSATSRSKASVAFGSHEDHEPTLKFVRERYGSGCFTPGKRNVRAGRVMFGGRRLAEELSQLLGDHGRRKHVPPFIFDAPSEVAIKAFLRGYWAADGYLPTADFAKAGRNGGNAGRGGGARAGSISLRLMLECQLLGAGLGTVGALRVARKAGPSTIQGRTVSVNDYWALEYPRLGASKLGLTTGERSASADFVARDEGDHYSIGLRSTPTIKPFAGVVYDLVTDGDFLVNNLVVHNCGGGGIDLSETFMACCSTKGVPFQKVAIQEIQHIRGIENLRIDLSRVPVSEPAGGRPWRPPSVFFPTVEWSGRRQLQALYRQTDSICPLCKKDHGMVGREYPMLCTTAKTWGTMGRTSLRDRLGGFEGYLAVSGYTKDDLLDTVWDGSALKRDYGEAHRRRHMRWLKEQGVDLFITQQFSTYGLYQCSSWLINFHRICHAYEMAVEAGIPDVALDFPPDRHAKWLMDDWLTFVIENKVPIIALNGQQFGVRKDRQANFLYVLKTLHRELPMNVAIIMQGVGARNKVATMSKMLAGRSLSFSSVEALARTAFNEMAPEGTSAPRSPHICDPGSTCSLKRGGKATCKSALFVHNACASHAMVSLVHGKASKSKVTI
jgi:intein/homing endonuclease